MSGWFGSSKQETNSTTDPARWLMPHIKTLLGEGERLYESGAPTFAGPSSTTLGALDALEARSKGGSELERSASGLLTDTVRGDYLDPKSNPYLQDYVRLATDPVAQKVNALFSKAGRYGSTGQGLTLGRAIGDAATQVLFPVYEAERGRQQGAAAAAPAFTGLDYTNLQNYLTAGQARDIFAQQETDDPYQRILRYLNVVRGVPQGTQSHSVTKNTQTPGISDILSTAGSLLAAIPTGGASLAIPALSGSAPGGLPGLSDIVAGGAGAGGGAGLSAFMFSDPDMKTDMRPVSGEGVLDRFRKLPVKDYAYREGAQSQYGLPERRAGPMADDYARAFGGNGRMIDTGDMLGNLVAAVKALDARTAGLGFGRRA